MHCIRVNAQESKLIPVKYGITNTVWLEQLNSSKLSKFYIFYD